ncbi:transglycosylase family protein [Pseudonocardia sp. C8]|uniref:LysM peptidoglycan-binding domain-containing protein n=1 Tax=Pseudonocardia sp. C8 TaxID=2762759 RepID=UPI0016427E98|nr:transglycosylase family protein [Pseudonocardia sp. C8]MBC3194978.1 transglycosylase family protein [Pseudonocardia sp. C8]
MTKGPKGRSLLRVAAAGIVAVGATAAISGTANAAPDNVWDQLAQCESGGNWSINTGNGYQGGLQFSPSTWRAYGGSGSASSASRAEQIAVAERVLAAQGWGAWPSCSKKLGITGHSADPGKRVKASAPAAKAAPKKAAPKAAAPKAAGGGYTVKSGDTLSKIAAAHGTSVAKLAAANGIADPDVLSVGQALTLR